MVTTPRMFQKLSSALEPLATCSDRRDVIIINCLKQLAFCLLYLQIHTPPTTCEGLLQCIKKLSSKSGLS